MGGTNTELTGPDFAMGVNVAEVPEGQPLLGHAAGEAVVLVRKGNDAFAVGATCTHYGGPLAEGLVDGDTIRCPWHHACFSLRTGEALHAPALNPVACWSVERKDEKLYVLSKKESVAKKASGRQPGQIVILGGGAAGHAAAEMLRREGYEGKLLLVSAETSPPVDRPNLSKDYLAGNAPEEWIPLRPPEFFAENRIELMTGVHVSAIHPATKTIVTDSGSSIAYDALLLATGGEPNRLTVPGADLGHVHYLRTLADSRAIIEASKGAKRAVIVGSSFIGLEAAASLRTRGLEVHVVAPEARPLESVMGIEIGSFVRSLHEEHGVVFHLEQTVRTIEKDKVTLTTGTTLPADVVVVGIGVKPRVELAEKAGLTVDRGIVVDEYLHTSAPGIFAAGDIARWPDRHSGQKLRVEHWVVAERLGQIAAKNMLGQKVPCEIVPFFWSQHYDVGISYVGHAKRWDRTDVSGSLAQKDCTAALRAGQKTLAVITIGRDKESLEAEVAFERGDEKRLARFGASD
jgi:NADPH-dependent 2,4-dienoyl-CoA reductase/sulfur reductase-like enzyme/nitrite reductase/ring-hydroxylating ferredoxin subunit